MKYKVFSRNNGKPYFETVEFNSFELAYNWAEPRLYHGNDQIEFEIRPYINVEEINSFCGNGENSYYLRKKDNKPFLYKVILHHNKENEEIEVDKTDVFDQKEEKYIHFYDNNGHCFNPLNLNESIKSAKEIITRPGNQEITMVEIRPAEDITKSPYHYNNKNSLYLDRQGVLTFYSHGQHHEIDQNKDIKEQIEEMKSDLYEKVDENILPPIEEINESNNLNPVEIPLLFKNSSEAIDFLILLNFIKPDTKGSEKFFKQELINKVKKQIGDFLKY